MYCITVFALIDGAYIKSLLADANIIAVPYWGGGFARGCPKHSVYLHVVQPIAAGNFSWHISQLVQNRTFKAGDKIGIVPHTCEGCTAMSMLQVCAGNGTDPKPIILD